MRNALLVSICLHLLLAAALLVRIPIDVREKPLSIHVHILNKPQAPVGPRASGSAPPLAPLPPVGMEEWQAELRREQLDRFNSKRLLFNSLFDRISSITELEWRQAVVQVLKHVKLRKGIVYPTRVWIEVLASGQVLRVSIVGPSSGVVELDAACKQAFEGRFIPNFPKSVLDKDGVGRLLWTCNVQG